MNLISENHIDLERVFYLNRCEKGKVKHFSIIQMASKIGSNCITLRISNDYFVEERCKMSHLFIEIGGIDCRENIKSSAKIFKTKDPLFIEANLSDPFKQRAKINNKPMNDLIEDLILK